MRETVLTVRRARAWLRAVNHIGLMALLSGLCLVLALLGARVAAAIAPVRGAAPRVWNAKLYHAILRKIHAPTFPHRYFNVTNYGAKADEKTDCELAFNHAICACYAAGGGTVVVPKGTYVCNGPITLLSNVNFHLNGGSQINFGYNPGDYLTGKVSLKGCVLVRYEGVWCYNYSPLIYAFRQTNVAVTGLVLCHA
ncbi:MAG: glycosyl hydrolase family 28-related protein [Phycisphaerae bacterium]